MSLDERKLAAARVWAVGRQPYLAQALFSCTVVAAEGVRHGAVDGAWRLYLDPEEVRTASVPALGTLLVHHAAHLLRDHAARARRVGVAAGTARRWGLAADAEINDDLVGAGLHLGDAVLPHSLGWRPGRLAEEYFHLRHRDVDDEPDCGSGADGLQRAWEVGPAAGGGLPPGEARLVQRRVAEEVLGQARAGRARVPASWRRWAEEVLEPRIDWRTLLGAELRRHVATVAGCVDYSYRRPSRRAGASPGVVLPSLQRPVPEVAVVCDTSGSMSGRQLARALAEVDGVLRGTGLPRACVRVLSVDAAVHTARRVTSARDVLLVGGGGTDMGAGIEAAARLRPRPSVVVVVTDGLTPWPAHPPRGTSVVVVLVPDEGGSGGERWAPPEWARVVVAQDG